MTISSVLFDLDGTFADTAQDLAYALNQTLLWQGREALPFEQIRPVVSHGGQALIELGFGLGPGDDDYESLRTYLLDVYQHNIAANTVLFPGISSTLDYIEKNGLSWGIVTNKPSWLTDPLMKAMDLYDRAACIVSGDTTKQKKPHPEPLLHAASLAKKNPLDAIYVGDAERDIVAGRDAGMKTIVALYGYIAESDQPERWNADAMVQSADELIDLIMDWS